MPKIIRIERDQQARFVGDEVQILESRGPVSGRNQPSRMDEEMLDAEIARDQRQSVLVALASGAWDTAIDNLSAYPESLAAAVSCRLKYAIGIRAPDMDYAPTLNLKEKAAIRREVQDDVSLALDVPGRRDMVVFGKNRNNESVDKGPRRSKKEVVDELTKKRMREAAEAKSYLNSAVEVVNTYGRKRRDTDGLFLQAVKTLKNNEKLLKDAFIAGQSVSGAVSDKPDEVEVSIAQECVLAERSSGRVWTAEERNEWVMDYLTNMARRVVSETGRSVLELDELAALDRLSVVDDLETGMDSVKVLLDIPAFDITFAESLGAKPGNRRMNLGVKVLLGPGNRIMTSYVSKSETVAASPETVDADASLVRGIDVLNQVTKGMFGGKKWRGLINFILGENKDRLPLAGNLVIGSTTGGSGRNAVMIPMLNAELGADVILKVKDAAHIIDGRAKQIVQNNPLINHPRVRPADTRTEQVVRTSPLYTRREETLPAIAAEITLDRLQTLPNAKRVKDLVARSVEKEVPDMGRVVIISQEDVEYQEKMSGVKSNPRAESLAATVIRGREEAFLYRKKKRAEIEKKVQGIPDGDTYLDAFDARSSQFLPDLVRDLDTALDWIENRKAVGAQILAQNPESGQEITRMMDELASGIVNGTSRRVICQRIGARNKKT